MLTPEFQRLREVRLCNINSLFITGSANINRFEHSVGTAYLAEQYCLMHQDEFLNKKQSETFVLAALLHDLANGPFGHSYEYICEKQNGFVPEQSIGAVINKSTTGSHGKSSMLEPIYFGAMNQLIDCLSNDEIEAIDKIVSGKDVALSKLICNSIDLDNIDNVFRMAYHMGIPFSHDAPIKLISLMHCHDGKVLFSHDALPFLYEWYFTREKMYKLLLLNPQEFSGKYMLTEAMDIVLDNNPYLIRWNFSDYELMRTLEDVKESWINQKIIIDLSATFIRDNIDDCDAIVNYFLKHQVKIYKNYKIYDGESPQSFIIKSNNMEFLVEANMVFKIIRVNTNVSQIISRLMTGDLYYCVDIIRTRNIEKYTDFLDFFQRAQIEDSLKKKICKETNLPNSIHLGLHPILDKDKTNRVLHIQMINGEQVTIGKSSRQLLIGVFIKNPQYGLSHMKNLQEDKLVALKETIHHFFNEYFHDIIQSNDLYSEVDDIE